MSFVLWVVFGRSFDGGGLSRVGGGLSGFFRLSCFICRFMLPFFSGFLRFRSFTVSGLAFPIQSFVGKLSYFFTFSMFIKGF